MTRAEINLKICEVLGIDPSRVSEVVLTLRADALPEVVIRRHVLEVPDAFSERQFTLVPVGDEVVETTGLADDVKSWAKRGTT